MPQASDVAEMGNPPFNIAKDVLLHHPVRGSVAHSLGSVWPSTYLRDQNETFTNQGGGRGIIPLNEP